MRFVMKIKDKITINFKSAILTVSVFYISSSIVLAAPLRPVDDSLERFNEFENQIYEDKITLDNYSTYFDHIQLGNQAFEKIENNIDPDQEDQRIFIHNYATLVGNYAEFLDEQHCSQASKPYWKQSESIYQTGKIFNEPALSYNHGLSYARQSIFYRIGGDYDTRLNLLKKAEQIFIKLAQQHPREIKYRQEYINALSDQLDVYQDLPNRYKEQQALIAKMTPDYFKILKQQQAPIDDGNTLIFIQQYFRYLYVTSPQKAEQWLRQQNSFIQKFVRNNKNLNQRELEFLAGYYALNRQEDQAIALLKRFDAADPDAARPERLAVDPVFANIRFGQAYQNWLEDYRSRYIKLQDSTCKVKT